jgi:hypothetical protein
VEKAGHRKKQAHTIARKKEIANEITESRYTCMKRKEGETGTDVDR